MRDSKQSRDGKRDLAADRRASDALRGRAGHQRHVRGNDAAFEGAQSAIQCISLQPDSPFNGFEGLKHMGTAIVPPIYDPHLADREIEMETEAAYAMARRLGRDEGLLVGISAGAAVGRATNCGGRACAGARSGDRGDSVRWADKYLSERFWEE